MYYALLIYHGKGEQLLLIAKNKIVNQIKSYILHSCHVGRFAPSIYSKLLRIIRQDGHYSSSGGMNTPHQEARANLFIVQTCNCN